MQVLPAQARRGRQEYLKIGPKKRSYNGWVRRLAQVALWTALLSGVAWGQMRSGLVRFGGGRTVARPAVHGSFGVGYGGAHFGVRFGQPYYPHYYHHHRRFPYYPYYASPYYPYSYGVYGYPGYYGYAGYYDPLLWGGVSYDSGNGAYYQQNLEIQQQLQQQVNELGNEVAQLRAEQRAQLTPPVPPAPPRPSEPPKPGPLTTLIFRDGHTEQVQNYGFVGHTLWIFNETRARKYSLDQLDIPATRAFNEDHGVDFVAPR